MPLPDGTFLVWYFILALVNWDGHLAESAIYGPIVGYRNCEKMVMAYNAEIEAQDKGVSLTHCRPKILTVEELYNVR